jgi:uncharacterized protein YggT (Ycf19 family)
MLEDDKLAIDESERTARHQAIKGEVRREMQGEISRQALQDDERRQADASAIGEQFREKAISEVAGVEAEIDRGRVAARVSQIVDYVFYLIYALISLEILLELLGARETNAFKNFIDALTAPLLLPFNTLMPDLAVDDSNSGFLILWRFLFMYCFIWQSTDCCGCSRTGRRLFKRKL